MGEQVESSAPVERKKWSTLTEVPFLKFGDGELAQYRISIIRLELMAHALRPGTTEPPLQTRIAIEYWRRTQSNAPWHLASRVSMHLRHVEILIQSLKRAVEECKRLDWR